MAKANEPQQRKVSSVSVGNAGEHLVMAELLSRGYHAFWADRGNPAFDIAVFDPASRTRSLIRVKTANSRSPQWSGKKDGTLFLELQDEDDFVAIVIPSPGERRLMPRRADIYVVPTRIVEVALRTSNKAYHDRPKKDGTPRKSNPNWYTIWFDGDPTNPDQMYGFAQKWADYHEAWELLSNKGAS